MTYSLGVDLGTTFTAAAVDTGAGALPLRLGSGGDSMPSVVALSDGVPVTGEAAEVVLRSNPAAGVREAKRRLGDSTPMVLDGTPYGAEAILGLLLADVVAAATRQQGAAPASVVLAHPATWGDYKKDLLGDTARIAGLDDIGLITEPQAAALHYVRAGELDVGQVAAVYDFGGGTFDAAVVRCAAAGPELLGEATGLERLGGIDLDQALMMLVNEAVGGALRGLDGSDPAACAAVAALRERCVAAKEALSGESEVPIRVTLPNLDTEVRLTRAELEDMVRPRVADTLKQLDAALVGAGVAASDLSAVLLVGGTSRVPLVGEMVAGHTGAKVVASADHKAVVSAGAAAGDGPVEAGGAAGRAEGGGDEGGGAFVVTGPAAAADIAPYRGGVTKRRLAVLGGVGAVAAGAVVAGAVAAGAVSPSALLGSLSGALGRDAEDGGNGQGGGPGPADGDMAAEEMDEFDDVAPPPPAAPAVATAGYAAYGATPMERATSLSPHRESAGPSPHSAGSPHRGSRTEQDGPTSTPPLGDADFLQTKARLLESIRAWEAPEGLDPAAADVFREQLLDRMERFQPMPGESTEHALQAMRDEYQDQVQGFADGQRLEELREDLDELLDERSEQAAADAAIDAALVEAKDQLIEGLRTYEPPESVDPDAYADMREDVEALIDRYEPVPGQTADEAIDELMYQYSNRVKDLAQDTKLEGVAEGLIERDDEPDGAAPAHWERGGEGEPARVWVDEHGERHVDQELGPHTVRDHRGGETEIEFGRAYPDRARDVPSTPAVTDLGGGRVAITFINEEGRHVTIRTDEPEEAIAKYQRHNPAPHQSGTQLAPDPVMIALADPVTMRPGSDGASRLLDGLGLDSVVRVHEEARLEATRAETPIEDEPDQDAAPPPGAVEAPPEEEQPSEAQPHDVAAAADDLVVGDELDLDAFEEIDLEALAPSAPGGSPATSLDEEPADTEPGPAPMGGRALDGDTAEESVDDEFAIDVDPDADEFAIDVDPDADEFAVGSDHAADEFAIGDDESADEFDTAGSDPAGDGTQDDPVLG